ncbi:Flagellin protein FlaA [hydrothermal vent metagenome]|uniref:Flagellin protein FlaA n=1 Tax=hydrothermal vent metagenome TaxID=652676 RepID=A0A3B0R929_9ZZZZ
MAVVINTNVAALVAQRNLAVANSKLTMSVQRLSSGYRINSAADDASGLARADQLRSQSRMIQVAMRNINDGVSAMEISDKAAEQITSILTRMGELSASASQGTLDSTTRGYYSDEFDKLASEIDRIANTTEFGGNQLIDGSLSAITMFIGFKNTTNNQLSISLARLDTNATSGLKVATGQLSSVTGALSGIDVISAALKSVNDARSVFGAATNRLSSALSNIEVSFTNFQAAESRIRDADFAYETAVFTRNQILVQAGTSILAQANLLPQSALQLLG